MLYQLSTSGATTRAASNLFYVIRSASVRRATNRLFHFPILPLDRFAVGYSETFFLFHALVAFDVDAQYRRSVFARRARAQDRQRYRAGALEVIVVAVGQHDAFALVEHRGFIVLVVKRRLPLDDHECVILTGMGVELILSTR